MNYNEKRKLTRNIKDDVRNYFKLHNESEFNVAFVLQSDDYTLAIVYGNNNPDIIYGWKQHDCLKCEPNGETPFFSCEQISDWAFSIDEYLFENLETGYRILYVPFEEHVNIWAMVDCLRNDIEHLDGVRKYLEFCKSNGITATIISEFLGRKIDITDLVKEKNGDYEIIHSIDFSDSSIVLARKPNGQNKYVTWCTTPKRTYGYNLGHYFSSYEDAYQDYIERVIASFRFDLECKMDRTIITKEKEYVRTR